MANLTPEDYNAAFGQPVPTQGQIQSEYDQAKSDPFGFWWRTFVEGKGPAAAQLQGSTGNPNKAGVLARTLQADIRNAPQMDAIYRAGAGTDNRANPYNTQIADQSRAAQLALINQMRGQMNGPSLAGLQGQRAMAQSGQQALGAAAMGAPGRAAMMQAGQVGGGMAGDIGQARLAEVMRAQAGMGGASGNLRGADLRSADYQTQAGLAQLRQDEALRQFYAKQGAMLEEARNQAATNRGVTGYQLLSKLNQRDAATINQGLQTGGTVLSLGVTGGK